MYYPKWVYNIRVDVTQRNMREYERRAEKVQQTCEELHPNFLKMTMRERSKIREEVIHMLGYSDSDLF